MVPKWEQDVHNWNPWLTSSSNSFFFFTSAGKKCCLLFRVQEVIGIQLTWHTPREEQESSWLLFVYMYTCTDAAASFLHVLSFARLCLWVLQHKIKAVYSPPPSFTSAIWSTFHPEPFDLVTAVCVNEETVLISAPSVTVSAHLLGMGCNAASEKHDL